MFEKLKQFKDMRDKANTIRKQLANESVVAEQGGVSVVMDGNQEVMRVEIKPELLQPDQKEKIEQATKNAFNDAVKKVQKIMVEKMRASGDFNLPGMS
jgi:nucleoid-associated protein EbfC